MMLVLRFFAVVQLIHWFVQKITAPLMRGDLCYKLVVKRIMGYTRGKSISSVHLAESDKILI
jgi:hypothetical protein